jgi:hypothetical protein
LRKQKLVITQPEAFFLAQERRLFFIRKEEEGKTCWISAGEFKV